MTERLPLSFKSRRRQRWGGGEKGRRVGPAKTIYGETNQSVGSRPPPTARGGKPIAVLCEGFQLRRLP